MQTWLLTILLCLFFFPSVAQDQGRLLLFDQKINEAPNDAKKIIALGELAEYYSVFKLDSKADSILQKAFFIAEISSDKDLVLQILFDNNITNIHAWNSKETFERSNKFIQRGLEFAQELNRQDYIALGHIRLAGLYRKRYQYDEAVQEATRAFTALENVKADSLRCVLYIELGDIYVAKADAVQAYKFYNNAFEIAYKKKNTPLQSETYHRFFELYRSLGNEEMGKKYLLQSLELNTNHHYTLGLFKDYLDLARITNDKSHIDKAASLANELNSDRYKLAAKRLLYYWYMVEGKNSAVTFNFLYSNPDLVQFFTNPGPANFHWQVGNIYRYSGAYDSAIHYYRMADTEHLAKYDIAIKLAIYNAMAGTYLQNKDSSNAKEYYIKTFTLSRQINQLDSLPALCDILAALYAKDMDFKTAYYYAGQADSANKILQLNAAKDKVVLLQVDRENKKRESDVVEATQKKARKNYLQIMAITLVITIIFAGMLFIGMFAVSKASIKMLGYFAFICLFEFIILLLDHPIIVITHGEPLKIWLIKIILIALLVPFQHFLEHGLIRFLQSRKLLEARQRFSLRNWWYRLKNPAPNKDAGIEEDTAVL